MGRGEVALRETNGTALMDAHDQKNDTASCQHNNSWHWGSPRKALVCVIMRKFAHFSAFERQKARALKSANI